MDKADKNPNQTHVKRKKNQMGLKEDKTFVLNHVAKQRKKPELKILKMLTNHVFCL